MKGDHSPTVVLKRLVRKGLGKHDCWQGSAFRTRCVAVQSDGPLIPATRHLSAYYMVEVALY